MADRGSQDWTPPGVFRALLWWPPVAFLLAAALPGAGLVPIIGSGLALALVGVVAAVVAPRLRRRGAATAVRDEAAPTEITRAAPEIQLPQQRAA